MAATPGNQWWKLRSKHGRDKIFSNPDILWEACCEYFEATDNRKWVKKDWVGKDAIEVERETETPYTISGLCLFLGIDENTWRVYRSGDSYKDFFQVVTRVEQIIYTQKFEGATVGAFSANIIARDLGLSDKHELDHAINSERNRITQLFKPVEDASGGDAGKNG